MPRLAIIIYTYTGVRRETCAVRRRVDRVVPRKHATLLCGRAVALSTRVPTPTRTWLPSDGITGFVAA